MLKVNGNGSYKAQGDGFYKIQDQAQANFYSLGFSASLVRMIWTPNSNRDVHLDQIDDHVLYIGVREFEDSNGPVSFDNPDLRHANSLKFNAVDGKNDLEWGAIASKNTKVYADVSKLKVKLGNNLLPNSSNAMDVYISFVSPQDFDENTSPVFSVNAIWNGNNHHGNSSFLMMTFPEFVTQEIYNKMLTSQELQVAGISDADGFVNTNPGEFNLSDYNNSQLQQMNLLNKKVYFYRGPATKFSESTEKNITDIFT